MELAPDITAEDLQVFLQEAEEHLQLLDEDIVRLEREGDNQELLQEIFRSAHTLKGSSAMLGHQRMTALAHVMATLLDLVRKGAVAVTTQVADALLHALDALTLLKEELLDENAPETDVTAVVDELERADPRDRADGEQLLDLGLGGSLYVRYWLLADLRQTETLP